MFLYYLFNQVYDHKLKQVLISNSISDNLNLRPARYREEGSFDNARLMSNINGFIADVNDLAGPISPSRLAYNLPQPTI